MGFVAICVYEFDIMFQRLSDGRCVGAMKDWHSEGHGEDVRLEGGGGGVPVAGGGPHPNPA